MKMLDSKTRGVLRRTALILLRITDAKLTYYAYDRHSRRLVGKHWRKGALKQLLRDKGYRWPKAG